MHGGTAGTSSIAPRGEAAAQAAAAAHTAALAAPHHLPDSGHRHPVLHHERVANGRHQGEGLLAGGVPPHQGQQGAGLLLRVQLLETLLGDVGHRQPAVLLNTAGKLL